jgi:hypothetical protein
MIGAWTGQPVARTGKPVNQVAPSVPGTTISIGTNPTVNPGSWVSYNNISVQWFLTGAIIPGATALTLLTGALGIGTLTCQVTATNFVGVSTTVTSNSITLTL